MNGFSRVFVFFLFIAGIGGCRVFEHTPYYETVDSSGVLGIQKLDTVLPEVQATVHRVTQQASEMWKDSGISLAKGQYVQIQAKGYWGCEVQHLGFHGPQGYGKDNGLGFPWCALLGKLGSQGKPFVVGNLCTFVTTAADNLFFVINDGVLCYQNNSGKLEISVALIDPAQVPVVQSAQQPLQPSLPIESQPSAKIECRLRLLHLKSGEIHGEAAAGCTDAGKIAEMVTFLSKKLEEKTMVRQDRVGILPLRESGDVAQKRQLGTSLREQLYVALGKLAIFQLLDAATVDSLLRRNNIELIEIGNKPLMQKLPEIDYLLLGEVVSK